MNWITENWPFVLAALGALIALLTVVNRSVIHFCNLQGPWYHRVLPTAIFGLTELFSVMSAADVQGRWKWPGTIKRP